jgi:hypothetical protein
MFFIILQNCEIFHKKEKYFTKKRNISQFCEIIKNINL